MLLGASEGLEQVIRQADADIPGPPPLPRRRRVAMRIVMRFVELEVVPVRKAPESFHRAHGASALNVVDVTFLVDGRNRTR